MVITVITSLGAGKSRQKVNGAHSPQVCRHVLSPILRPPSLLSGIKSHSAWSESSTACLRPWGGHRKGEKLAPGAFATLQRRGPQGRAHIWVVFSCTGTKRGEWRGPKGHANAFAIVVLWRKEDWAARPVGPSRRARFWWRLIKNAKF